jgi:hypothetical protein
MIPFLAKFAAKAAALPHGLLLKAASYGLVFMLGMAVANSWATRTALEVAEDRAAKREAAVGGALIIQQREYKARLEEERAQEQRAQTVAYDLFQQGMEEAQKARAETERRLALEFARSKQFAENIDGLKEVNKMLAEEFTIPEPPSGCMLSVGVRRAIDAAIDRNNSAAARNSEADAARLLDGPDSPAQLLTCEQLAYGVTDILEHDAMLAAWVLSWQAWAKEALR